MRITSSSILHRFKFDGIEYQKDIPVTDDIIPFGGTGEERTKNTLINELIPGQPEALPVQELSQVERCILHQAISNSIYLPSSNDDKERCAQVNWTENTTDIYNVTNTPTRNCPRQQGVIRTPYGTVAPGVIIGAVAACLQHQNITVKQLIARTEISHSETNDTNVTFKDYSEEDVDLLLPKSEMVHGHSMWYTALMNSTIELDNVWLTTIAGELAETVIYQGPMLGDNMTLGATGFWQDETKPNIYYLSSDKHFHATRAELMGGIDGMIIASYLPTWVQNFYSLRLSQILEMYYSYEGITFNLNVKACNRAQIFLNTVQRTILNEQTFAIAQTLAYRSSIAYIAPERLQRMVDNVVEKFYTYADNNLFPTLYCRRMDQPRVEAMVIFDGGWTIDYTIDFLARLVEDLDVSMFGSKMGVIHGTSGEWLVNVTNSPSLVFQGLNNFTNASWPAQFNYTRVLEVVSVYLDKTLEQNQERGVIGTLGQVVILLVPLGYITREEQDSTKTLLRKIKSHHPDVHFIYYVSQYNENLFQSFILSDEDHIIKNSNRNDISEYALTIPRTLRPAVSLDLNSSTIPQLEDYISPSKSITYKIHSDWRQNMKELLVTIHTFGYGTIQVCLWTEFNKNEKTNLNCTDLNGSKEIALTDNVKCGKNAGKCPNVYIGVQNATSLYKCAEIDCKTPDQVRYIVRTNRQDLSYNSADKNTLNTFYIFVLLIVGLYI